MNVLILTVGISFGASLLYYIVLLVKSSPELSWSDVAIATFIAVVVILSYLLFERKFISPRRSNRAAPGSGEDGDDVESGGAS